MEEEGTLNFQYASTISASVVVVRCASCSTCPYAHFQRSGESRHTFLARLSAGITCEIYLFDILFACIVFLSTVPDTAIAIALHLLRRSTRVYSLLLPVSDLHHPGNSEFAEIAPLEDILLDLVDPGP